MDKFLTNIQDYANLNFCGVILSIACMRDKTLNRVAAFCTATVICLSCSEGWRGPRGTIAQSP